MQIYDSQWRFLRGWHVDALAGSFKVECTPDGSIEVLTARRPHQYLFTQDGKLISTRDLPDDFDFQSLPTIGASIVVPASPFLWVFSSPFLLWALAAVGMIGLVAIRRLGLKRQRTGNT